MRTSQEAVAGPSNQTRPRGKTTAKAGTQRQAISLPTTATPRQREQHKEEGQVTHGVDNTEYKRRPPNPTRPKKE